MLQILIKLLSIEFNTKIIVRHDTQPDSVCLEYSFHDSLTSEDDQTSGKKVGGEHLNTYG